MAQIGPETGPGAQVGHGSTRGARDGPERGLEPQKLKIRPGQRSGVRLDIAAELC
jgi:hypothetical protein